MPKITEDLRKVLTNKNQISNRNRNKYKHVPFEKPQFKRIQRKNLNQNEELIKKYLRENKAFNLDISSDRTGRRKVSLPNNLPGPSTSRSQRPQFRPQWMSPEEFADKNHPKWEEYRRRISIAERVSLIHRDWGAGNTIDLTRNLTKHQFSKIQNRHVQMPLAGCQYCTHRCHCSPGRKIIRPYPIGHQDKLFLDPDVDVKTEKLLEKSEDVATEIRGCLNTAMHNEVPNLSENPQEYDNYAQVAKDLMESANEIFDTAKHFPYTELGPDMSQEQVRELLSVELTQDKYRKIYNSPYEGADTTDEEEDD